MSDRFHLLSSWTALITFAGVMAAAVTFVVADETQPAADSTAAVIDTVASARDSAFAEINRGFIALEPILVKGCFDCHTDRTRFPWYHSLPIIKGMIDSDIRGAQKRINMSDGFPFPRWQNQADALADMRGEIKGGDMPPFEYRLMHWDAKPSEAEADSIYNWIDRSLKLLAKHGIVPSEPSDLEE